jgi:hypothetical protein
MPVGGACLRRNRGARVDCPEAVYEGLEGQFFMFRVWAAS